MTGEGFCRVLYGGRGVGSFPASHQLVDELHRTGSKHTYESLVFGSDEVAGRRKQKGERVNSKPITAELGNATPPPRQVAPERRVRHRVAFAKSFARLQIHSTLQNAVRLTATVLSGIPGKRAQ